MYLSRLALDPRDQLARRDIGDCQELHRTLLSAFADANANESDRREARTRFGLLYRVEADPRTGQPVVIAQSQNEPDWGRLPTGYLSSADVNPICKPIAAQYAAISDDRVLRFRLRANPTKRCGKQGKLPGQRLALTAQADQLAWLERKAATAGFSLLQVATTASVPGGVSTAVADVRIDPVARQYGWRTADGTRMKLTFGAALFEGLLRVTDAVLLRQAIAEGIGRGKAYGFGLLSVAPA